MGCRLRCFALLLLTLGMSGSGCRQEDGTGASLPPQPLSAPELKEPPPLVENGAASPALDREPLPSISSPQPVPTPAVELTETAANAPGVLYADSFEDVKGSVKWHTGESQNAQGPPSTRLLFFFMAKPHEGPLKMQVTEDQATLGPDEQPGVLALSWQQVPTVMPYSGFAYLGGAVATRQLALPALLKARSADDLRGLRLKFRYRGINEGSESPVELKIGIRLEPNLPDSFRKRLGMGTFVATAEWGTYDVALTEGDNQDEFFRALAEENPSGFKLIWSQSGSIKNLHSGDTLLLDDLAISRVAD